MNQAESLTVERSKALDVIRTLAADEKNGNSLPRSFDQNAEKQIHQEDDNDLEPFNIDAYKPASEEILTKLLNQAEFYFSDSNVLKDKFLMKTIQSSKGGFVSIKLLSSFRRMQSISKDWRDLAYALRRAQKLELNAAGNKIRRKDPLPQWDDSVFDKTIVALNFQIPEVSVNAIKLIFGKYGDVTLVRVLQPGKILPEDLQPFATKHPEFTTRVCAVVEFGKEEHAQNAIQNIGSNEDGKRMMVLPLRGDFSSVPGLAGELDKNENVKIIRPSSKGKENAFGRTAITVDSSPSSSPSTRRKKTNSRSSGGGSGGIAIPDKRRLDSLNRGSPVRSPAGGGRSSPRPASYVGSMDDRSQERYENRTPAKMIPGRMQHHRGTPVGSPDVRGRGADESPLSCSPGSLGTSPWIRRRALLEQMDPSSSPGRNLITVTRQPRGPDGGKGFNVLRSQ